MPTSRPISQLPTYAEAISAQSYTHEPMYMALTPAGRTEGSPRRNPPVHDISAGDRFVAFVDIGIRKAISKIMPSDGNKRRGN